MSERAQALEAAEPWREQVDRLRLMAENADGDWDLSDNDRAAIRAALDRLAAPPVGVSPQPEGTWPTDYIGRSFVDGASWWQFHHNGSTMFASEREEAEAEAERRYGPPLSPVEPTPPHKPKSVKVDVTRKWCQQAAQAEPDVDITVGVEPTPEPPINPPCRTCGHPLSAHRPEFGVCDGAERPCACPEFAPPFAVEPTPDAQVCVWQEGEWDYESGCRGTQISRDERSSGPPDGWKHCPYCGKRLEVGTAPQGGEQ